MKLSLITDFSNINACIQRISQFSESNNTKNIIYRQSRPKLGLLASFPGHKDTYTKPFDVFGKASQDHASKKYLMMQTKTPQKHSMIATFFTTAL